MNPILVADSRHASGIARSLKRALSGLGLDCPLSRSQETVARMFGHRDWHGLRAASSGRPASPTDDLVDGAEYEARARRFAEVLATEFGLPVAAASEIVRDIRPTGLRRARTEAAASRHPHLDKAILAGRRFHVFLSGGGLRVVRVEAGHRLVGYGEAPHLSEAFALAEEDTRLGGRPYAEVYGKLVPHYLTGDTDTSDEADAWVRCGRGLDAHARKGRIVVELTGSRSQDFPEDVMDTVTRTGEPVEWDARGMRFRARPGPIPNSASMECVGRRPGVRDPFHYAIAKRGVGSTLEEALAAAVAAEEVEVDAAD